MKIVKYVKIPLFIIKDSNISFSGKILYGILLLLSYKTGYCFANNKFLSIIMGIGERRITALLKILKDNDYIFIEYKHKFQRKIFINKEKFTSIKLENLY